MVRPAVLAVGPSAKQSESAFSEWWARTLQVVPRFAGEKQHRPFSTIAVQQ
jgi:hypothetical protein